MANIKEVASIAGVSISTVSRVISGNGYVKQETRLKVLEVIRQTGYAPNVLAKSLKMGRSHTICLLMPSIENLVFPIITKGIEDTARKHGFNVILCNTNQDAEIEKSYINEMKTRWIDGFISCGATHDNRNVTKLREEGFPLVLVARFQPSDIGVVDIVSVDNYTAAYTAVSSLIASGHKKIAFAFGNAHLWFYQERLRGYVTALQDHGITYDENLVMRESAASEDFYDLTVQLMQSETGKNLDAIFCTSDPKAYVVLRALHDLDIPVPESISVMGVDDVPMSALIEPPLSTVSQPLYEMGVHAALSIIKQIEHKNKYGVLPTPVHEIMHTTLKPRKSTRDRT